MRDEDGLQWMQFLAAGNALNCGDIGAVMADRQGEARIDSPAIDQNGAGAALTAIASLFGSGQIQLLTQEIE
jgi:hypothetical protein